MKTGIDAISFYTPRYYFDLRLLAEANHTEPDKYIAGLGQKRMSVPPPDEDIVTMAASAALPLMTPDVIERIETCLFATESSIDQSKAGGVFVHQLLGLPERCRVVELKQACYSGTAALKMAMAMVAQKPEQLILVLTTDIARYGLGTPGEPTQGCGAVAMLVGANPRLVAIEPACGILTQDVMDFWRPNYSEIALVDGHYSTRIYLSALKKTWQQYQDQSGLGFNDIDRFCYHLPFTRMAVKAHRQIAIMSGHKETPKEDLEHYIADSLHYNRVTGNTYTASLYEGLTSLLDLSDENLSGKRIGFFSYGSGCVAEFFGGIVQDGYQEYTRAAEHESLLQSRHAVTYENYKDFYTFTIPQDGDEHHFGHHKTGAFRLAGVEHHKRLYEKNS